MAEEGLIKARREAKANIFIHNDLSNAAYFFKERIEERVKKGDRDGIAFDCIALATLVAFTFEAHINFLGWKVVDGWKEFEPFETKIKKVYKKIGMTWDKDKSPGSVIWEIKQLRDVLAHGKPKVVEVDEVVIGNPAELAKQTNLRGEWEEKCTPDLVLAAYKTHDDLWNELIKASKIEIFDTMTHGMGGLTFIEHIK